MASTKQTARDRTKSGTTSDIPGARVVGHVSKTGRAKERPAAPALAATLKKPSIRQSITDMLNGGSSTSDITVMLQEQFPGTKAAENPKVHIAFYRSRLKKEAAQGSA